MLDRTGLKFGRLTIIRFAEKRKGEMMWWCRCDCGKEKAVRFKDLKRGMTKSCGCIKKERCLVMAKNKITHGLGRKSVASPEVVGMMYQAVI
jgi:hypothetical protein